MSTEVRPAARRISSDAEAVAVARELAAQFAVGAALRDAERLLPYDEIRRLAQSGLLGITVPHGFGGADVSAQTLAEVFRLLSAADPNIAQIPQSHFAYVNVVRAQGSDEQQAFLFGELLEGRQFGNAQSEAGTKHVQDYRTRLTAHPDGGFRLDGVKSYCTGALFADWVPVLAKDEADRLVVAFVRAASRGLTVVDDWDGMGQRTTASGTVRLEGVHVDESLVLQHFRTFEAPQLHGAQAQLLHAAIDVGIARGALLDAGEFVRTKTRPWFESGSDSAVEDPLLLQQFGELEIAVRSAEALLREAGRAVDTARPAMAEFDVVEASIAVATAKAVGARTAVQVADALFEVSGTRSALDSLNLHRHWRNARTHTLHDPVRWKVQHIGRYALAGTPPPRHGLI